jgi:hypothetical protein
MTTRRSKMRAKRKQTTINDDANENAAARIQSLTFGPAGTDNGDEDQRGIAGR